MIGCDNGGGGGGNPPGGNPPEDDADNGGGGTFTMTGIPAEYNGKYALLEVYLHLMGAQSINWTTETFTLPRISGGSVNIPLWIYESNNRYFGNDTLTVDVWISNSAIWSDQDEDDTSNFIGVISFGSVAFSNGNATRPWNMGVLDIE
jgi:hypothetical protein